MKRPKILQTVLGMLLLLPSCATQPEPGAENLISIEYFQRMDRQDFLAKFGFLPPLMDHLMPPALAELPPQYQTAFSLYLQFDHDKRQLLAEYHYQKLIDPQSHVSARKTLSESDYTHWLKRIEKQNLICQTQVSPGWSGPAPEYLLLRHKDSSRLIYAGGKNGPDGPDRSLSEQGLRAHLCQDELQAELDALIAQMRG